MLALLFFQLFFDSFCFASCHCSNASIMIMSVSERNIARQCIYWTRWGGTLCARCWSRCKLRNSIRLEKAAQALDGGGWQHEMQVDKRGKGYLCSIGFHLACMLGWQKRGSQGPAQQQFQGKEGKQGKENNILLHYKAICSLT